ncbi:MAG TPA: serine/threonine-protein kinase [Polyangiaceae bacterium]|nr:serine/threonine-protein kinase [Polyangiaceae bacterium]
MTSEDVTSSARSDPRSPAYGPGDIVEGKYRIEQLIGSGGMAWVFRATHLSLNKRVAIKFLRIDSAADNTESLARFRREGLTAASIAGEATARVLDVGTLDSGAPFLVMEYLEGCDLDRLVGETRCMSVETAVHFAVQACEGLAETHVAGIVHRDLKPSNLFLTRSNDGTLRMKLLDFGVSKFQLPSGEEGMTSTGALIGSPVYMSPEQMRSSRNVDHRSDIWSMGVILYELLAEGRSPFMAPTLPEICARILDQRPAPISAVRPQIPRALEAVVLRCLEKNPSRRFQTVANLADALVPFGTPETAFLARRIRAILGNGFPGAAPSRWRPRVPRPLRIAVALLVLAVPATRVLRAADDTAKRAAPDAAASPPPHAAAEVPFAWRVHVRQDPDARDPSIGETVAPQPVGVRGAAPTASSATEEAIGRAPGRATPGSPAPEPATRHVVTTSGFVIAEFGGRE